MKNYTEKREIQLDQIHGFLISLYLFCKSPGHSLFAYNLFFCYSFIQMVLQVFSSDVFELITFFILFKTRLISIPCFTVCLILLTAGNSIIERI